MKIKEQPSLKPYNTFGVDVLAHKMVEVENLHELKTFLQNRNSDEPLLVLGGGSNILFTKDFQGTVLRVVYLGKTIIKTDHNHVWVRALSGENWHDFVLWTLEQGFGGLENLSLIPGNVGTAPIQNIGAYGVEIKDLIFEVEALSIDGKQIRIFNQDQCQFSYRESIFKGALKGKYVILSVCFKLIKHPKQFSLHYGAIAQQLKEMGITDLTPQAVSQAIIAIRKSKLPDPNVLGNSGSFFKNPIVSADVYEKIKQKYPDVIAYKQQDKKVKLAAAWLIQKAGWKGKRIGDAGVHNKQALVLVNYGGATGKEIYRLAQSIMEDVRHKFGIALTPEVNIIQ